MKFTPQQVHALLYPVNPNRVASRNQGGRSLSYMQAWDIRAMLIRTFGFGGFSIEVLNTETFHTSRADGDTGNWTIGVTATVRLTIHDLENIQDVTYTEIAAASQTGPQVGEVMDFALKTAVSDAMKRCAINLGTQFGLSLYAGTTGDIVRVIHAPGQTTQELQQALANQQAQVPEGAAENPAQVAPAEVNEKAEQQIERATTGAARRGRQS